MLYGGTRHQRHGSVRQRVIESCLKYEGAYMVRVGGGHAHDRPVYYT